MPTHLPMTLVLPMALVVAAAAGLTGAMVAGGGVGGGPVAVRGPLSAATVFRSPVGQSTQAGATTAQSGTGSDAGDGSQSGDQTPAPATPPTSAPTSGSSDGRTPARRFRWPLTGVPEVVHRFAPGPFPWSPGHRGVDLGSIPGAAVLAAGSGTVTFVGPVAGRGVVVIMHPGGLRTTYEPVSPAVRRGQAVAAGERIGTVASTATHCSPDSCLHWGALRGAAYLDPLLLLGMPRGPAVLLPVP